MTLRHSVFHHHNFCPGYFGPCPFAMIHFFNVSYFFTASSEAEVSSVLVVDPTLVVADARFLALVRNGQWQTGVYYTGVPLELLSHFLLATRCLLQRREDATGVVRVRRWQVQAPPWRARNASSTGATTAYDQDPYEEELRRPGLIQAER